jgi:hypothetical protein
MANKDEKDAFMANRDEKRYSTSESGRRSDKYGVTNIYIFVTALYQRTRT